MWSGLLSDGGLDLVDGGFAKLDLSSPVTIFRFFVPVQVSLFV